MKRPIERIKKVRVNITIDENVFLESGKYINNLSGYINAMLKNHIERQKLKEVNTSDDNIRYVKSDKNKKPIDIVDTEPIDLNYQWW